MAWIGAMVFIIAWTVTIIALRFSIPSFRKMKIVGRDVQKPDQPWIPEMGGVAIVAGFAAAVLFVIASKTFFGVLPQVGLTDLLAILATVLLIALVGIFDDLIEVGQVYKAVTPAFAALPLIAVKAGHTVMNLPVFGYTDLGWFYSLVLIPLGVTGAANAMNMLAGFNGVEAGIGAVVFLTLTLIAASLGEWTAVLILVAALGATLAFLLFNWYPAKVFIGDVGTLALGAVLASVVITGNFEMAGIVLIIPHLVDFFLKLLHGFPKTFGRYQNGKLFCPEGGPVGLGQLIMKLCGGVKERTLTLILIGLEALMGLIAIGLYARY